MSTLPLGVQRTNLFRTAQYIFDRRRVSDPIARATYAIPVTVLVVLVVIGALVSFGNHSITIELFCNAPFAFMYDNPPASFRVLSSITIAYLVGYVWILFRLSIRMNIYDITPVTYYLFSVRLLSSMLMAVVITNLLGQLNDPAPVAGQGTCGVVLASSSTPDVEAAQTTATWSMLLSGAVAFLIGWNPNLWIQFWAKRFANRINKHRQIDPKDRPERMPLWMIAGLTDDKVERLAELDIDNVQQLGSENPLAVWVRTPFNLQLITGWVAQAQLSRLLDSRALKVLEGQGINDIFAYVEAIKDSETRKRLTSIVSLDEAILLSHIRSLREDPDFCNLDELRIALLEKYEFADLNQQANEASGAWSTYALVHLWRLSALLPRR